MFFAEVFLISALFFAIFASGSLHGAGLVFLIGSCLASLAIFYYLESLLYKDYLASLNPSGGKNIALKKTAWKLRNRRLVFVRFFTLLNYVVFMLKEMIISSFKLCCDFYKTRGKLKSGFVYYSFADSKFLQIPSNLYIFAVSVTLTPSTITYSIDEELKIIKIHYCCNLQSEADVLQSTRQFEARLCKIIS